LKHFLNYFSRRVSGLLPNASVWLPDTQTAHREKITRISATRNLVVKVNACNQQCHGVCVALPGLGLAMKLTQIRCQGIEAGFEPLLSGLLIFHGCFGPTMFN
jgi:hypothetical protein